MTCDGSDRGDAEVVGVVLLIGFTVIVATAVGAVGQAAISDVTTEPPEASVSLTYDEDSRVMNISLESGNIMPAHADRLRVEYQTMNTRTHQPWRPPIRTNDNLRIRAVDPGTTVRIVWVSDTRETKTIAIFQIPAS